MVINNSKIVGYLLLNNKKYCGHCWNELIDNPTWKEDYQGCGEGTYVMNCDCCKYENLTCQNVLEKLDLEIINDINYSKEYNKFHSIYFKNLSKTCSDNLFLSELKLISLFMELKRKRNYHPLYDVYGRLNKLGGQIKKINLSRNTKISLPTINFFLNNKTREKYKLKLKITKLQNNIKNKKIKQCLECNQILNPLKRNYLSTKYCDDKCKDKYNYKIKLSRQIC